ncbi:DNA repair exonuclease SbcCD nuclease subunit [Rhodobacter aestuarii]|uniref:DNA repair exonuclease SbcCD nuclease subunit n=1 Tax=Rhodobacter aestuarii TaxID=453582 RepID=A0A1N7J258_9RHOB|nr:metallophosphoesterase [Rhodobacter aestuarii]PTV97270.1 DNA repair exonuclease SbcCD nuclease subunit [Rhodobacter aestuarii]SIS43399.1 DNA repair exonuclease SbcCD nuclease subunit [Rhodobacter aestuarii]
MAFSFLHASDLHLGKPFGGYPEAIRNRLREARHGAIAALATAARSGRARHVLLAGDTFDAETPAPETLRQALSAMAEESDIAWTLLPGNHDSLAATELWRRIATEAPENLRVLTTPDPIALSGGVYVLPAPCTQRRPGRDLTEAMSAPTPEGAVRIGLGHGAITDFSGGESLAEEGGAGIIPPDRATRSGLDYLALGDWHGQMQVGPRTWYSGTPEPDGFKHDLAGGALLVSLDRPGDPPDVTPMETGHLRWHGLSLEMLPGEDTTALLDLMLPGSRRRNHLVKLVISGRLPLAERAALEAELARLAPEFGWWAADLSRLGVEALPEDLDQIDRAGALRQAAEVLLAESGDLALSQADRDVAARALARLYALSQEVQA